MKLTDNCSLQMQLDSTIAVQENLWQNFKGKSFLVTGATGLLGSQVVLALLNADKEMNLDLKIYALVRNKAKAEKIFKYVKDSEKLQFVVQDISQEIVIKDNINYIIHGASMTGSKDFVDYPVNTINTALKGTLNVIKCAKSKKVDAMVYLSSLEVYGVVDFNLQKVDENTFGSLNPMSVRSSYSESKRMAECLCAAYAAQYGVSIKVVRLCQTFGAGVEYNDNRVFAQFARSIIEGKDIVLKTDGSTQRNYCSVDDAVRGILTVLANGKSGEAYNIANKNTLITIKEMAEMIINRYPDSSCKLVFDIAEDVEKLGYNPKVRMNLDTEKIQELGWQAYTNLPEMFDRLIESMKFSRRESEGKC